MMRIFISYRRSDDAGSVGRVRDRLRDAYGADAIFRDVDGIPKGTRFSEVITEELATCDALLVVIGPRWLAATDAHGNRRLDDPEDWVRTEVELGLARTDLRVVPVLVGGAQLPTPDELPESMRGLLSWNAAFLVDDSFDHDFDVLLRDLGGPRGLLRRAPTLIGAAAAVVALAAGVALLAGGGTGGGDAPAAGADLAVPTTTVPPPEPMTGGFNIAVAAFTSSDPATQTEADVLADRLTNTLREQLGSDPDLPDVEVRGPDEVGTLDGDTGDERAAVASAIADELNADVVIDGRVDFSDPSIVQPGAALNPKALGNSPDLGGYYSLGTISYPGSYSNQLTEEGLLAALTNATGGLAHFVRGVSYYQLLDGVPDPSDPSRVQPGSAATNRSAAAAAFRAALASPGFPDAGKEAAQGFLGSLALVSRDHEEAEAAFRAALALNPASPRAKLGLAEIRFQASRGTACAAGTVSAEGLEDAAAQFAAVEPSDTDPPGTAIKRTLGEARVLRCLSQAGLRDEFATVDAMLRQVIADAGPDPAQQELAAAAHGELALVLAPAGRPPEPAALEAALASSRRAYSIAKRQENQAVFHHQAAFFLQQLGRADEAAAELAEAATADPAFRDETTADLAPQGSGRNVPAGSPGDVGGSASLAFTGDATGALVAVALALLAAGMLLVSVARRAAGRSTAAHGASPRTISGDRRSSTIASQALSCAAALPSGSTSSGGTTSVGRTSSPAGRAGASGLASVRWRRAGGIATTRDRGVLLHDGPRGRSQPRGAWRPDRRRPVRQA